MDDADSPDHALEELYADADYLHQAMIVLARNNPNVFAEMVLRDEETGGQVRQTPYHCEWNRLLDAHPFLVILAHVESAKSQSVSIARTLYSLGKNPLTRIALVSNTKTQAEKLVRTVGKYITDSDVLHEIFPGLMPDPEMPWTSESLYIKRGGVIAKDPSVQASMVHGPLLGTRLDYLVLDDILDYENTRTPYQRDELEHWFNSTTTGRLTAASRVAAVGTAWHPDDLYHRFAKSSVWTTKRFPVLLDNGQSAWPQRWPIERINQKRELMGTLEFARQLMCVARDEGSSVFKQEWMRAGLERGRGKKLRVSLEQAPNGRVITGVDLAVSKASGADLTVLFTILVNTAGDREILNIESGRLGGPEIIQRIKDVHRRYGGTVIVEDNAAQRYIVQMLQSSTAIPVKGCTTTGQNKSRPEWGIQQIAVELENGKWIIPNENGKCHPEVDAWMQELLFYTPEAHAGDRLMANFMALQGIRMSEVFAEQGRLGLQIR